VPSERFTALQVDRAVRSGRCELRWESSVVDVEERTDDVIVATTSGASRMSKHFNHVFDGRPPSSPMAVGTAPLLAQHFAGQEVEFDVDVLDPAEATLMDFDVGQDRGLHFVYVLPFTSRRALIESTYMTPAPFETPDYVDNIRQYCMARFGRLPSRVVREERGVLPMCTRSPSGGATRHVWPIGTRGGVARAATGYAFDAIQRDSDRVCAAFLSRAPAPRATPSAGAQFAR